MRPAEFLVEMERKLIANRHKGGWDRCSKRYLLRRLREEVDELARTGSDKRKTTQEAADVANFAYMIADVFGVIGGGE